MMPQLQLIADLSLAQSLPPWWRYYIPALAFAFCFGACVGSFINVVIYRLPAGISIISPPSRCPTCGARLTWRENLPILGWLILRGKCRFCEARISPQYMIVELFMAVLFLAIVWLTYIPASAQPWECTWFGPWWHRNGVWTLPALAALLVLLASLVAMTIIDARTFTIPIEIPLVATIVAFVAWPVQALLPTRISAAQPWPIPLPDTWAMTIMPIAGMTGVALSLVLMRRGVFRQSFIDYDQYLPAEPAAAEGSTDSHGGWRDLFGRVLFYAPALFAVAWAAKVTNDVVAIVLCGLGGIVLSIIVAMVVKAVSPSKPTAVAAPTTLAPDYPHARREMLIELAFLAAPIVLMAAAALLLQNVSGSPPHILRAIAGAALGYLVGGGVVWGIRIFGTLLFGREAMGLGDVHLLAAVGAVVGWMIPVLAFFGAAFVGLGWVLPAIFLRGLRRELPYGPHLAVATLLVLLLQSPPFAGAWSALMGYLHPILPCP